MKIRYLGMFVAALIAFAQSGCESVPAVASDSVKILEVQSTQTPGGELTSYKVRVHYELGSKPKGKVMLGFDSEGSGAYKMVGNAPVKRGSGEVELLADVKFQNRYAITVYVNLSEDPHPASWQPLASDTRQILLMP